MRTRPAKERESTRVLSPRCALCVTSGGAWTLSASTLKKKYYYPQTETYYYRTANNLIYDPGSREAIQVAEMNRLINRTEYVREYSSFKETALKIKKVITERAQADFYGWVDFRAQHYDMTHKYYLRRKVLFQTNKKLQKCLQEDPVNDGAVRQYIRKKIRKELDSQRKVKLNENGVKLTQCDTNSSTIDLKKLTHGLQSMIETIANLSCIKPHLKLNSQNNLSVLFKTEGCGISAINKIPEEPLPIINMPYQETYGLEPVKPKHKLKKNSSSNKIALKSMQKINGVDEKQPPQTPQPRPFHAGQQYDQIDRKKTHSKSRGYRLSQGNKIQPMSPGNRSGTINSSKRLVKTNKSVSKKGK